jgi:hypothetical protein
MCGSEALEAAEGFAKYVANSQVGKLSIQSESNNDLVFTYVVENKITTSGSFTEVYRVEADLDSHCTILKVEFLGYK